MRLHRRWRPEASREDARFEASIRKLVRGMITRLPPLYRRAVAAVDLRGKRQVEAAREIGISVSGMKSRVQRRRKLLKEMLLDCCRFDLDRRWRVIDYQTRCRWCSTQARQTGC